MAISGTGTGIPENRITHVFERFFSKKGVSEDTGPGLRTACDIIKKHNGEIEVASRFGEGTTFALRIPKNNQIGDFPA